jgi:hypothetical protein
MFTSEDLPGLQGEQSAAPSGLVFGPLLEPPLSCSVTTENRKSQHVSIVARTRRATSSRHFTYENHFGPVKKSGKLHPD